jgi:hypothetical protein
MRADGALLRPPRLVRLSTMLIGIDVLAKLRDQGQTLTSLASVLPAGEGETQQVLELLMRNGWVSGGSAGFGPSSMIAVYTITHEGRAIYDLVLDRWANQIMGPPEMSVLERFLAALAHDAPNNLCQPILDLLNEMPATGMGPRPAALALAKAAAGWAGEALDADLPANEGAALGMRSLPLDEAEELGYAAAQIRDSYASGTQRAGVREVLEQAAACLEAAWDLRLQTQGSAGSPTGLQPEPSTLNEIADHAALTLQALFRVTGVAILAEARTTIGRTGGPAQ